MLTGLLARNASAWPLKTAVVQGERRICHEELNLEAGRMAARLRRAGVHCGDAVAIVLSNSPEFIFAFFAILRVQAIAMPLNPGYTVAEMAKFLLGKPVRVLITERSKASQCRANVSPGTEVVVCGEPLELDPLDAADEPFAGDALYLFTSGSTGSTKRVLFNQRNLHFEALNFVESTGIGPEDPIICPVPLFHSYGLCLGMLDAVYTGATLVLEPEPEEPFTARCGRLLELLRQENVRVFPSVPRQFAVLADSAGDVSGAFRDVKWCLSSGDMLPRCTFERFLARTGRRIRSFYGSTEAGSAAMETGPEAVVEFETVGAALKNVTLAVRDRHGAAMAQGEAGEIWIENPALPPTGYDDDAERTREVFRDGWYNSGDLGSLDAGGRLFLAGRKQSIINTGSYKVDATEVEETLLQIPGMREAAVVGVEVPHAGTMVKAVLAMNQALPQNEIRAFCQRRLAMFKVPRIIDFVNELPRDTMGKILRRQLSSAEEYVSSIRDEAALRVLDQVQRAPAARQRTLVMQMVERQTAAVLGRDNESLPRDAGFADLGLDSFASIELLTRLDLLFGPGLSQTFTFDYPTIAAATGELVARLRTAAS